MKFALRGARRFWGSAKDIDGIFEQLATQSASLRRRTVVLIDDIDRLNASETRQILQLVKLTARFPYVTYVLAFDRTAVASALQGTGIESGEEYLEKIFQVSFDLPTISEATLSSFLAEGIDSVMAKYKPAHFDMHRFGNLSHAGFRSSFSSVRHIRRFLNGLEFSLSLIGHEVNGVDIIGIEALKTFYPRTFDAVRNSKSLFAGHIDPIAQELGAPEYRKKLDQVRPEVEVKKVAIPQGEETYILCRTRGRKEKEKAIRHRFSAHMEDALNRLAKTIATGRLKDRNKMERRLGRIQARPSQVNDLYEVALRDTPDGVRLHWEMKQDRKVWRELREGAYMLRNESPGRHRGRTLVPVYAANRSRGLVPHAEKSYTSAPYSINWSRESKPMSW